MEGNLIPSNGSGFSEEDIFAFQRKENLIGWFDIQVETQMGQILAIRT